MTKALLGLLFIGVVAGVGIGIFKAKANVPTYKGRPIPPEGLLVWPQGANPGNPENAIKDFKRLWWAIDKYRAKYGELPDPKKFRDTSKPLMAGVQLTEEDFTNPDSAYFEGDPTYVTKNPYSIVFYRSGGPKKANGNHPPPIKLDAYPAKNEKYVWVQADIYKRDNNRVFVGPQFKTHYSGCDVVLWNDGKIEVIPNSHQLVKKVDEKSWRMFLPGSSLTPKDAVRITEMWRETHREPPGKTWSYEDGKRYSVSASD